jgi:sugar transferase (PEP-CTERM system associated)
MNFGNDKDARRSNFLMFVEVMLFTGCGYFLYLGLEYFSERQLLEISVSQGLTYICSFTFLVAISALSVGLYDLRLRETYRGIVRRIFVSVALAYGIMELLSSLAFSHLGIPRYFLPMHAALIIMTLVVFRYLVNRLGMLELGLKRIIVIGAGDRASIIEKRMRREVDRFGFDLVGFVPVTGDDRQGGIQNEKLLDVKIDDGFKHYIAANNVDELVIACDQRRGTLPVHVLFDCKLSGIAITDLLDFMERETGQIVVNLMYPSWVIYSDGFSAPNYLRDALDYSVNCFLASIVVLLTWPFMLVTAIAIFLSDITLKGASVLYRQERVGLDGRLFNIIKFRSMQVDAEKDGPVWASENDARVTKIGQFIRKFRIDELPQVINVFKGEMAFIGPRPERPEFVEQLIQEIPYYNQRHNVKPGLAGWAQLNYPYGSSVSDALEKLKFDLYYVKHQSLMLDVLIFIRTTEVVLFGKGR